MKWTVVRYRARPDRTDENQRLSEAVFRELDRQAPQGIAYSVFRLEDGTFIHVAAVEDGAQPVSSLTAFQAFRRDINERCIEPPLVVPATLVGHYGRPS
jgi:hypothetical protein